MHAVVDAMPASDRHALVMKSTVPVGTGESIERVFAEQEKGFSYVSCPEFLKEGSAVKDFLEPDRVVIGDGGDWAGDAVEALYAPLDAPIVRTDVKSAEMVKLASNAFLATKISFINEIANVCEETGADVVEVARGMGLDDRIGPKFLQAGIGFGGSCFPKDVTALKQLAGNSGYHFQLLNSVIEVNELQKRRVIAKLQKHLGSLVGKEIALLGLAFKPNTDDMREASSLVLSSRLQGAGAHVRAYDPVAEEEARKLIRGVEFASSAGEAIAGADAVVLVTEWPEFRELDLAAAAASMRGDLLVDGRNFLDPDDGPLRRPGLRGHRPPVAQPGALMQALILAGGEGTRLRPLTSTVPKPVVPLVDRPFIAFMLDWLRGHGVDDVIMSCGFLASGVRNVLGDGSAYGLRLRYVEEPQPLGTGGALKFAEELLDERFLMLNGDVLTDLDVTAQLALHEARGAQRHARAHARRGPLGLRPGPHARRRRGHRLRREAGARPDRHAQHLGGHLRARALGARAARGRPARLDRARRLPAARRRRPLRLRRRGLLARHRDARALPRGHVRHPRGHGRHRGRRPHGRRLPARGGRHREPRPRDPVRADRARLPHRRRRAHRRPRRARDRRARRRGHDDRARGRAARLDHRRGLHAARLHRRRGRGDRRRHPRGRPRRARRGRHASAPAT